MSANGTVKHGTYLAYVSHKCRCDACREANNEYARRAARLKAYGRSAFVDAEPVRERVRHLMANGMSGHEIMRASGVTHTTMQQLMRAHWRTGKPIKRMKRENADAIMGIRSRALLPGTYIERKEVVNMVLDLMALGYSAYWICQQLGMSYQGRERVLNSCKRAGTYAKLVKLHGATAERAPDSPQATRSRNFAQQNRHRLTRSHAA